MEERVIEIANNQIVSSGTRISDGFYNGTIYFNEPDPNGHPMNFLTKGYWYVKWDDGIKTLVERPNELIKEV